MGSSQHVAIAVIIIIYDTSWKFDKKAQIKWSKIKIRDIYKSTKPNTGSWMMEFSLKLRGVGSLVLNRYTQNYFSMQSSQGLRCSGIFKCSIVQ